MSILDDCRHQLGNRLLRSQVGRVNADFSTQLLNLLFCTKVAGVPLRECQPFCMFLTSF
jgi:hypothetical protein